MKMNPRESGKFIMENPKHLKSNEIGIQKVAEKAVEAIVSGKLTIDRFSQCGYHPDPQKFGIEKTANWLLVCDTLNFCFWSSPTNDENEKPKWTVNGESGYYALCTSLNRAIEEGKDVTSAMFMSSASESVLQQIFRPDDGHDEIPLLAKRVACLQQVGCVLNQRYNGNFVNVIKKANNSAKKLLELIVSEFPSFKDEAIYKNNVVTFYKRAQILVGDVWACYKDQGLGQFDDIKELTMFADYRVPQVLVYFGALEYFNELQLVLESEVPIEQGTEWEVEIRGASIHIVEKVVEHVLKLLHENHPDVPTKHVTAVLLDHFLWDYRRLHAKDLEHIPYHRVQSIYY